MSKWKKSKINKDFKINPQCKHKINTEIDFFIAGQEMGSQQDGESK